MPEMLTADGRIVTIPDGLESQFAGLQPVPSAQQALAAVQDPILTQPPTVAPVTMPEPVQPSSAPPPSPPEPQPVAPPEPTLQPLPAVTNQDLAAMGEAGPANLKVAALDQAKDAAQRLGTAQANQMLAISAVEKAANDEADRQLLEIRQQAEANAKAVQDATDNYVRNAKAVADKKVDHGMDNPVMVAIGFALNALGTALKGGDMSKIMQPIYDAVDRKVKLQMADIDNGRANLALQREALGILKQSGNDKVTLKNTLMLAGLEQAKRRVEEVKTRSTSDISRAQTDEALANLNIRIADTINEAHGVHQQRQDAKEARAQAERLARSQMWVQMRGQDLQDQAHRDSIAAQILQESKKALSAGNVKLAEDIQKRAIGGEVKPIKDEKGNVIGSVTGLMRQKHTVDGHSTGDVFIPTGTDASVSDLQKQQPVTAALIGTIDEILRLGPEWLSDTANTDKKQKLDELFGAAKTQANVALGLGVPTGKDIELSTAALGTTNPSRFKDSIAGLRQARKTFARVQNERFRAAGLDHDWIPVDLGTPGSVAKPGDEARKLLFSKPDIQTKQFEQYLDKKRAGLAGAERTSLKQYQQDYKQAYIEFRNIYDPGASIDQQNKIEELRRVAIGSDKEAQDAVDLLTEISKKGPTESIRRRASDALSVGIGTKVSDQFKIPDELRIK